jgi:hypothetical protein
MNHSYKNTLIMKFIFSIIAVFATLILGVGCDAIKNLPTNTTGTLFSLNGSWKLASSSEGNNLVGSIITVYPLAGNALVKTIANSNNCIRKNDELWKSVKANATSGFTNSVLVAGCNDAPVYKEGVITVVTNDKITINSLTAINKPLNQTWERVK